MAAKQGRCRTIVRTLEPLRCGDRQKQKRVAQAGNPLQSGSFEVSLS
jgi:hypothetical protein